MYSFKNNSYLVLIINVNHFLHNMYSFHSKNISYIISISPYIAQVNLIKWPDRYHSN